MCIRLCWLLIISSSSVCVQNVLYSETYMQQCKIHFSVQKKIPVCERHYLPSHQSFPINCLSFHPAFAFTSPCTSSAWQSLNSSAAWYQLMLYQRMPNPQLTVHRGIWKLSRRLTTHSWESTATSLSSPSLPTPFPQLQSCRGATPPTQPSHPGMCRCSPCAAVAAEPMGQQWPTRPNSHPLPAHCTQAAGDHTRNKKKDNPTRENWREIPKQWLCGNIASPVSIPPFFACFSVSKYFKAEIWSAHLGSKQAKFLG